jgi:CysZ protein
MRVPDRSSMHSTTTSAAAATSRRAGFLAGFAAPWAGFRYMQAHPRLWRHAILPILCNLALTLMLIIGLAYAGVWAFHALESLLPSGAWYWDILRVITGAALVVVILVLTLAAWILFQGILCGHFYSLLAREVEIQLGLKPEEMREVPLRYQITDAVLDLIVLTGVSVGCFVLSFVPLVGAPCAVVIGGYFNCFVFGMDYLDYPQALRAFDRNAQREFARKHRRATLGLGASVSLLTFVPVVNSILLTTAATGAVLLYRRLEGGRRM